MWFVFKILVSLAAFFIRFAAKYFRSSTIGNNKVNGVQCNVVTKKHKNSVTTSDIHIPFKCRSVFKITRESKWDVYFKKIGIADELQTGDRSFDKNFYLASDCSAFRMEIKNDEQARELVSTLFDRGCEYITCDGTTMTVRFPGDLSKHLELQTLCTNLYLQLSDLDKKWKSFLQDPFAIKALIIEAIIWTIASYAVAGFIEWAFVSEDVHLSPEPIIIQGLLLGVFFALVLVVAVIILMRGSSRGHRIIVESLFVLVLSLPMGGVHLIGDLNRAFDKSNPYIIQAKVESLYQQEHKGRKGRKYYTYHLHVLPISVPPELSLPRHIQISSSLYSNLRKDAYIEIKVGHGYLNHKWYQSIEPSKIDTW